MKNIEILTKIANALVDDLPMEAQRLARKYKTNSLKRYFQDKLGWDLCLATSAAMFCKGNCDWEIYKSVR